MSTKSLHRTLKPAWNSLLVISYYSLSVNTTVKICAELKVICKSFDCSHITGNGIEYMCKSKAFTMTFLAANKNYR